MSSIKPLAIIAILAAVGVGLYIKINSMPEPEPPPEFSGTWGTPPTIDMGNEGNSSGGSALPPISSGQGAPPAWPAANHGAGGAAPAWNSGNSGGEAPPYTSGNQIPRFDAAKGSPPPFDGKTGATSDPFAKDDRYAAAANPAAASAEEDYDDGGFQSEWQAAQAMLAKDDLVGALRKLSPWYGDPSLDPAQERELVGLLGQLAGTVIYSTKHALEPAYVVSAGERLSDVAAKYDVPTELLANINGISDPDRLQAGTSLKVIRGPFMAVVSLERHELVLALDGMYAGRFTIGVGEERPQMEGDFIVHAKQANPTYFGRDRVIDASDPNNPLGEHLVALRGATENAVASQFGIHGTSDPSSVGRESGPGFIRLAPRDAADVYGILSQGSQVTIRR